MQNQPNQFEYTYSAPTERERKEIMSIRRKYEDKPTTDSKLERLRRLDAIVKNRCMILSLTIGIIGCLIFGLGLAFVLEFNQWFLGIICGVVGAIVMIIAYPLYRFIHKKDKSKYGEEIVKLSQELLGE
jgi:uncharacterized membrane protein YeaQ/YmgE (transglycosylase-associated protein family)